MDDDELVAAMAGGDDTALRKTGGHGMAGDHESLAGHGPGPGDVDLGRDAPARRRTPRATSAVPLNPARLLRMELRRSAMPWMLPLIAALFWFDSYRPSVGTAPVTGWGSPNAQYLVPLLAHAVDHRGATIHP